MEGYSGVLMLIQDTYAVLFCTRGVQQLLGGGFAACPGRSELVNINP